MISIIIALILIGAALYLLKYLPIDATIKKVIQVILIVAAVVWLLRNLGTFGL